MADSILGIGLSGLAAAQAGLATTGHNIANVNTPGYSRQEILQRTALPLFTGGGYLGQGVQVADVRRVYSDFLGARAVQSQADASALATLEDQLHQLDSLFGDPSSGLSPALDGFFAGINAMSANPGDMAARQAALAAAQTLVGRFHQQDEQLATLRDASNDRIAQSVDSINAIAQRIATLNRRITEAESAAGTQRPNDLLDARDALVAELNAQVGAHAVPQTDGSYNVFLSNGLGLVVGTEAATLAALPDAEDPQNLQVAMRTGAGYVRLRSTDVSGGALAGAFAFRDQQLAAAQNSLGRIAVALGTTFNAQHALGQDRTGAPGGAFFSVSSPVVREASTNAGNGVVTAGIADATALTASDYRLSYDGASYRLTRLADGVEQAFAALPQTVDGIALTLASGAPAAGDTFLIQPTRNGASDLGLALRDPAKIAAAAPVRAAVAGTNTGTATIAQPGVDASYPAAPLASPVTLTYASATGMLTGFPATAPVTVTAGGVTTTYAAGAPVPYTAEATVSFGGISFSLSGAPGDGDTFTIAPNTGGVGDGRNAQLLTALARANIVGNATTYGGAYAALVSAVGGAAQQAQIESDTQAKLLDQAKAAQSAVSGVNLDEEAANLQRYQQAYQAAGKLMAIAASLFQTILDVTG